MRGSIFSSSRSRGEAVKASNTEGSHDQQCGSGAFNSVDASDQTFVILHCRRYGTINRALVEGAIRALTSCMVPPERIHIIEVPTPSDLPFAASKSIKVLNPSAVLAIGCIMADNPQYVGPDNEFNAACKGAILGAITKSLLDIQINTDVPIVDGILSVPRLCQAQARCGLTEHINYGYDWGLSAAHVANLTSTISMKAAASKRIDSPESSSTVSFKSG
ncbi:6,7-dimethyl-8-ribityllumazine synthase [Fonticula alba]|uniref:6,7-dimethyl-8-ribityllumazine synthase n=1 Tax=Fonticula alba TaxID=691883 RepID=A0A058Z3I2_FONAL|nr:6,7-dimethyl-8-ribityllumazine synthase [Fonticula alba]KCV68825.1 6,7-dimethyl-8-ribityllumazine synthase [Fonticula alba]|eukprot:XP_009496396.1 6,7-dimethyl-8-ribityllumazine synthase [Fonticula alba]